MNNLKLSDLETAVLFLIRDGRDDELNLKWGSTLTDLLEMELIQFKPNTNNREFMLTITGEDCLNKGILIKYPLQKSNISSYNDSLRSMNDKATDALICAMMNELSFDKLNTTTARTLGQHFLDIEVYKKWNADLINKWSKQCVSSLKYLSHQSKKHARRSKNKHKS